MSSAREMKLLAKGLNPYSYKMVKVYLPLEPKRHAATIQAIRPLKAI